MEVRTAPDSPVKLDVFTWARQKVQEPVSQLVLSNTLISNKQKVVP